MSLFYARGVIRFCIVSIVVAAFLSSCSTSGGDVVDQSDPGNDQSAPSSSPLESALGFASEPERRQYQLISMQREADTSMVQCMKGSGFFYAVQRAEDAFRSGAFVGDGTRDWTTLNGLGITSSFIDALAVDAMQAAPDAAATNLGYVASLTNEQATDYDRALVGELGGDTTALEYAPAGCWGEAYSNILRLVALLDEFDVGLDSLNSRLTSDPRVLGFQESWASCMQAAGYNYPNDGALVDDVYARLLDIELVENDGANQVVSGEVLDDLAAYEREVAVASFDCRLGFEDELARLRFDYEQEFLDDNRFRIAELQQPAQ